MDAEFAAALSLVLAATHRQVKMKVKSKSMIVPTPAVKRTVLVLFAVAFAFYLGFILMAVSLAAPA